jgi:hypothetical protein
MTSASPFSPLPFSPSGFEPGLRRLRPPRRANSPRGGRCVTLASAFSPSVDSLADFFEPFFDEDFVEDFAADFDALFF